MSKHQDFSGQAGPRQGMTFRPPRAEDAIGFTLASIFSPQDHLPEELIAILARLDHRDAAID